MTDPQQRHDALVDAVRKMRNYQQQFFRNRNAQDLKVAKEQEKIVDHLLKQEEVTEIQQTMF